MREGERAALWSAIQRVGEEIGASGVPTLSMPAEGTALWGLALAAREVGMREMAFELMAEDERPVGPEYLDSIRAARVVRERVDRAERG